MLPFIQWSALSSLRPFMYPCIDQSFSPDSQGCSCEWWAAPCSPVALPGPAAACQSSDTAFSVSYRRWKPGCDVPAMGQHGKRVKKMKRHLNYPQTGSSVNGAVSGQMRTNSNESLLPHPWCWKCTYCSSIYLSWGAGVSLFGGFTWVSQILQKKNHIQYGYIKRELKSPAIQKIKNSFGLYWGSEDSGEHWTTAACHRICPTCLQLQLTRINRHLYHASYCEQKQTNKQKKVSVSKSHMKHT